MQWVQLSLRQWWQNKSFKKINRKTKTLKDTIKATERNMAVETIKNMIEIV